MTTSVLNWVHATPVSKSGNGMAAFFTDLKDTIDNESANANFLWQSASILTTAGLQYLVLKRKDGSAGRILLLGWSASSPASPNPTLFTTGTPTLNRPHMAWFPNGNTDTPSQLASGNTGTIMGDDTGCTYAVTAPVTAYGSNYSPWCWASEEIVVFGYQNTSGNGTSSFAAGALFVDRDDNASDGAYMDTEGSLTAALASTLIPSPGNTVTWSTSFAFGFNGHGICVNDAGGKRALALAAGFVGSYADNNSSAQNVHIDTALAKAWFQPIAFLDSTKGGGWKYKMRQLAIGPPTASPLEVINTATLSPAAVSLSEYRVTSTVWGTNFKV